MRFRERLIEISSKAAMVFATLLFCLWMMSSARAATQAKVAGIKAEHSGGAHEVTIELSSPIESRAVRVENQRNFIQISLQGASAAPARNESVSAGAVNKIFSYQYQPDLARVRLIMDREAREFQDATEWKVDGRFVRVRFGGAKAADVSAEAEARLVKEILAGKPPSEAMPTTAPAAKTPKNVEEEPVFAAQQGGGSVPRSAGESAAKQAGRMGAGLLLVLALLGLAAMGLKRFQQIKGGTARAAGGRILETVASHSLGAKKQLTLVRAADQYLLLGVTDHSVNLVAALPKNAEIERAIDEIRGGGDGFESMLAGKIGFFSRKQAEEAFESMPSESKPSVRESIKKRMEGFKPLY
ncbi:MAG: flagellar biosynthetic protein FliO [Bdellovibrionales bacterium]|nr:flagellar biosynthetic protein FliO [Bdellovibrionales bacterium]